MRRRRHRPRRVPANTSRRIAPGNEQSMGVGRMIGHGLDANERSKMEQKKRGPLGSTDARRTSQVGKGVERGESTDRWAPEVGTDGPDRVRGRQSTSTDR